nr:MAG TPA: hypothetical protein [Caudoviricetes sp.]
MPYLYLTYVGHGWPYKWTKWPYRALSSGQNGPIEHYLVDKMAL